MRQSQLFSKTEKEEVKGEESRNAQLLLRGGFINKEMAGVYSYLPLGLKVLNKISHLIRKEMDEKLKAQEVLLPALHPLENYRKTGREGIDVLFHTQLSQGKELVLGQSHEEIVVPLLKRFISSYKDLPLGVYQIQTKFRNELRAKAGILRGREFLMKDLYSFHQDEEDMKKYYEKVKESYYNIFDLLGIGDMTYLTYASGGTFSEFSHEFQTITKYGEDTIYLCFDCQVAINKEIVEKEPICPQCKGKKLEEKKSIEVANIFPLYRRFSDPFKLSYLNEKGEEEGIFMGCYGIGISRVMGAIVESLSDDKGIVWPESISPFKGHLIPIGKKGEEVAEKIYPQFKDILYDDREKNPGEKLADADLIGLPIRIIISDKTLKEDCLEIKRREEEETKLVKIDKVREYVK